MFRYRVSVVSAKGGVGKSSSAAFLAKALALKHPNQVGLLDADLHGPSIPKLLGTQNVKIEFKGEYIKPITVGGLKVMSLGFFMPERVANLWAGADVHMVKTADGKEKAIAVSKEQDALWQCIYTVDWGDLEYFVIDHSPGSGDEWTAVMNLLKPNGAVVVTTPRMLDTIVIKTISALRLLKVPIIGTVENFAGFVCPECKKTYFAGDGGSKVAEEEGLKQLAKVPQDLEYPKAMEEAMVRVAERIQTFFEEQEEKMAVRKEEKKA